MLEPAGHFCSGWGCRAGWVPAPRKPQFLCSPHRLAGQAQRTTTACSRQGSVLMAQLSVLSPLRAVTSPCRPSRRGMLLPLRDTTVGLEGTCPHFAPSPSPLPRPDPDRVFCSLTQAGKTAQLGGAGWQRRRRKLWGGGGGGERGDCAPSRRGERRSAACVRGLGLADLAAGLGGYEGAAGSGGAPGTPPCLKARWLHPLCTLSLPGGFSPTPPRSAHGRSAR